MALPAGRILGEVMPLLRRLGIEPEPAFDDPNSRQLRFATSEPGLELIRVRNFDVATFVAFGAAQLGIAGNDVLMEFDYSEIYAPLDLDVGHCHMAVAASTEWAARNGAGRDDMARRSHIRVATKYPEITRRHFAARGVQAECIKLNGAIELAPSLGLCRHIVDLVQTGATLKANGLIEIERIAEISSRLIVNRPAVKTRPKSARGLDRALPHRGRGPACCTRGPADGDRSRRCRGRCGGGRLMPVRLSTRAPGFEAAFARFLEAERETAAEVDAAVAAIIADVARRGDAALFDYTRRFDGLDLAACGLRLTRREIAEGAAAAPPETVAALRLAAARIESFHRRQLPAPIDYVDAEGVRLGQSLAPDRRGRALCAGRHRRLPVLGADECDPCQGRRRRSVGDDRAGAGRGAEPARPRRRRAGRDRRNLSGRRGAGDRGARLRHGDDRARSTRSSVREMPMSRRPSARSSAGSGST